MGIKQISKKNKHNVTKEYRMHIEKEKVNIICKHIIGKIEKKKNIIGKSKNIEKYKNIIEANKFILETI